MSASQNKVILRMLEFGSVTPLDALEMAGVFRLSARIFELRQMGHDIVKTTVEKNGKHFASYRLVKRGTGCKK